jgi:hypothetical protein
MLGVSLRPQSKSLLYLKRTQKILGRNKILLSVNGVLSKRDRGLWCLFVLLTRFTSLRLIEVLSVTMALAQHLWALKPNAVGVNLNQLAYVHQPNSAFNADANKGHGFAIVLALVGALRPSGSGAG